MSHVSCRLVCPSQAGPIPIAWAVTVLRDISRALLASYRCRIVQMDMKDSNVMIDDAVLCWRRDNPEASPPDWWVCACVCGDVGGCGGARSSRRRFLLACLID